VPENQRDWPTFLRSTPARRNVMKAMSLTQLYVASYAVVAKSEPVRVPCLALACCMTLGWPVGAAAQNFTQFQLPVIPSIAGISVQAITEFPIPTAASRPFAITAGPDGALWFTETGGNKIGRITTTGASTEFTIPTAGGGPVGIAAGPDGALWFTEIGGNKIGRIATTGTITEFTVPTAGSELDSIAAGPDGALWFTEDVGNKIGRITTTGTITEFTIPTAASGPEGIAAGPDGALWFAEVNVNKIGRITITGTITEFTVPTGDSHPFGITAGPDGALWFTEASGAQIGRITTTGSVAEFAIPTGNSIPSGITAGPDGALWFTEQVGKIGRITTTGTITEFMVPTAGGGEPAKIATGPDGALWFTEEMGNNIGRLVPASIPSPLLAAVLPESRSAQPNGTVTAFASLINTGTTAVQGCSIVPDGLPASGFVYQTTNPATNAVTGTPNTPVNIPGGGLQTFVIAITPTTPIAPTNVAFNFSCTNVTPAPIAFGLNTLLLQAAMNPTPDVIALAATLKNDGIVHVTNGSPATGVFAVASDNLGSGDTITVTTNTGAATLPITVTVCQTNPATGACMQTATGSVATPINSGATPTFGIFVTASGNVPFDPANNRIFVTFTDSSNTIRGETSVAVETM
jgi:virginiamycin B lyase